MYKMYCVSRSFRNSGAHSTGFGTWSNENAETSQSKPSDADKPIGCEFMCILFTI